MSRTLLLRPAAETDIRTTHNTLEETRPGLGKRFAARLRETLERIESSPELFGLLWQDVRAARVRKFRYVVYFVIVDERIEVLAVLHGARDSSEWQERA